MVAVWLLIGVQRPAVVVWEVLWRLRGVFTAAFLSTIGGGFVAGSQYDGFWINAVELRPQPAIVVDLRWPLCLQSGRRYEAEEFRACVREDSLSLLRWAHEQGYWFARVEPWWDAEHACMYYVLYLGKPVTVEAVEVASLSDLPEPIQQRVQQVSSGFQRRQARRDDIQVLLKELVAVAQTAGYLHAWADVQEVRLEGAGVRLRCVLYCGEPARADTVLFHGLRSTRDEFLRRWVGIEAREVLSDALLERARHRLQSLPWIEVIESPRRESLPDGRWAAVFTLRERSATRLEGFLGYAPPSGGAGGWSGMAEAQLGNLFGSGRSASLRWYRAAAQVQELSVRYTEPLPPWVALRGQYELRQYDTTYSDVRWELGVEWLGHLSAGWQAELFGGWRWIVPSGNVGWLMRSRAGYIGGGFQMGQLHPAQNPAQGVRTFLRLSYRWQRYGEPERRWLRVAAEAGSEAFVSVMFPLVARLHIQGQFLVGAELRREEFYRVGGVQSLRGYREAQFATPRALWGGMEGRWLLNESEYAGVFVDIGWMALLGWRVGVGTQWQLRTAAGALQLQLGWAYGEPWHQARLGVRIASTAL
ncbi:MAG: hypothetical protein NZ960_08125 [Candidatus Kapabacteria bacterium]|nr:hypothetical protein [Candidatus Kapabacteria bacterium]MDW8012853.1 hypothetical protein [Bacteroidota bacterium]